ncbi:MAG: hypothetical protein AAFR60_05740 [Pseudomonadota bacterium]
MIWAGSGTPFLNETGIRNALTAAATEPTGNRVLTQTVDGAFTEVDRDRAVRMPYIFAKLKMTQRERNRLRDELRQGRVRIAAITLYDNLDQDGDAVLVTAAGFSQKITITHQDITFFIPVVFGSTVRITAVQDGGGGNVTVGIRTAFGPVSLAPLAPGQSIDIPVL